MSVDTTEVAKRTWTKVTIELVEPGDPEYGEWAWTAIGEGGDFGGATCQATTLAELEADPLYADLCANKAIARRIAGLLEANPDVVTEGKQFRVRVHHPDTKPTT